MRGVMLGDGYAFPGWVGGFNGGQGWGVEGGWVVEKEAVVERGEASVEVVKTWVDEMQ